jgi:hypothetical protein
MENRNVASSETQCSGKYTTKKSGAPQWTAVVGAETKGVLAL